MTNNKCITRCCRHCVQEEALKVKLATLLTMRTLAQKGAAGFKWALMATAAESAEALAQMSQLTGLSEGLAPAEVRIWGCFPH
eukprot:SAG31_NODE_283_length_18512_cov_19.352414_2_plen_83_part_00